MVLQTLDAVSAPTQDLRKVKTALISVFDKTDLQELVSFLATHDVKILSTGGTAKALRDAGYAIQDVSEYTGFPEILDGRVKTLHPRIHGGILAARGNSAHAADMVKHDIQEIDLVVSNLYPFSKAASQGSDFETCIENIDIGGPSMIRAAAKNNSCVCCVTDPSQYPKLIEQLRTNDMATCFSVRKAFALSAFKLTSAYDAQVSRWLEKHCGEVEGSKSPETVTFHPERPLKYGLNPHQTDATLCSLNGSKLPFKVVSGSPGYVNLLDALNAWALVTELAAATSLPAAASFKHVSPAGAAVGLPLTAEDRAAYDIGENVNISEVAAACIRARNGDSKSSFGDFVAVSHIVDLETASILKGAVSDGIIAKGYTDEALAILKEKKRGAYIVLESVDGVELPRTEYRTVGGVGLVQSRNDVLINLSHFDKVVTKLNEIPESNRLDLLIATIVIKYTQSNSVGYAKNGMMLGIGAGQQSRIDCVKLAGKKSQIHQLLFHPKVRDLRFKSTVNRTDRVNARIRYIEGDIFPEEHASWQECFEVIPETLTLEEKQEFLQQVQGLSLSSDAFFPFRDNIDNVNSFGVKYIAQPGGSVQDDSVIKACDDYGIAMTMTGVRLFHH